MFAMLGFIFMLCVFATMAWAESAMHDSLIESMSDKDLYPRLDDQGVLDAASRTSLCVTALVCVLCLIGWVVLFVVPF